MAAPDVVSTLQREVEIAREGLKNVDENIKKLTGRDPAEPRVPGGRRITLKRNFGDRITGPSPKRFNTGNRFGGRVGAREQRLGKLESDGEEDEDDDQKPTLQSSVVATPTPPRIKQESPADPKTKTRNKRMFGVLLGTLQKFRETSTKEAVREKRRQEIEKKLEVAAEKEKHEAFLQRKELYSTRKEKQVKLQLLERQMEVAEMLDVWEEHDRKLSKFIKTKASPTIYYLPAKHNDETLRLLEETEKASEEAIKKRRVEVEEFLKKPAEEPSVAEPKNPVHTEETQEEDEERVKQEKNDEVEPTERDRQEGEEESLEKAKNQREETQGDVKRDDSSEEKVETSEVDKDEDGQKKELVEPSKEPTGVEVSSADENETEGSLNTSKEGLDRQDTENTKPEQVLEDTTELNTPTEGGPQSDVVPDTTEVTSTSESQPEQKNGNEVMVTDKELPSV